MLRILITSLLFVISFTDSTAQKLDHVLGEIIVELPQNQSHRILEKSIDDNMNLRSPARYNQLMSTPMNLWTVTINPNTDNENQLLKTLKNSPYILKAQRNHITQERAVPNDTRFANQWQYINDGAGGGSVNADLDMDLAWDITTGGLTAAGDTIVVCVVDDGLNLSHPDMQGNMWINHDEIPNNSIDDDNNGYIDDYQGWNAESGNGSLGNDGSHGTPVTGIIGARGNNELGVAGINWDVKVMTVVGGSPESVALASYAYAYSHRKTYNETNGADGAFVVATNSSWGIDRGQPEDAPIWCEFYNLMGEEGIISCGATANANFDIDVEGDLPTACSSDYLISVTNLERNDQLNSSAGYGLRTIDLGAYGEETYTLSRNNYGGFGGTSGATPHVAGVVALAYSTACSDFLDIAKSNPGVAAMAVKDAILFGTTANDDLEARTTTNGRLNAYGALSTLTSICDSTCSEVLGLHTTNIAISTISMEYFNGTTSGDVEISYREIDSPDWVLVSPGMSPFDINSLEPCTMYEYRSRTMCNGEFGEYSYTKEFTTEGCCESPLLSPVVLDGDVATVTWTTTIGSNEYTLEYKIKSETEWNSIVLDGNTFSATIPGIQECTAYDVRIKAICDISNRESEFLQTAFSGPCGGCTQSYCVIDAKDTSDEWIESVSIAGVFQNISGDNIGAANFLDIFEIKISQSLSYDITLIPGYTANAFAEFFKVYIDFDQNGIFEEENIVYEDTSPVQDTVTGNFLVPEDAVLGTTRMRVIMRFSEPNDDGCDATMWTYGEYEDYCITIIAAADCPDQISLASNIDSTESSIAFELFPDLDVLEFNVEYKKTTDTDFTALSFNDNEIKLTGLDRCTDYDIKYTATCLVGDDVPGDEFIAKTSCISSTAELEKTELSIFPNPSFGAVTVTSNENIVKLDIISIEGKIHQSQLVPNLKIVQLDETSQLSSGIYFIRATSSNGTTQLKKWMKY